MSQLTPTAASSNKHSETSDIARLIRDPVTGLYTRAFMEEYLALELSRARRQWYPIGVLLLRPTNPKSDDALANSALDVILHVAAAFLGAHVRRSDVPCRYRDMEFALVLPKASPEIASQRAAELTRGLHDLHIVLNERIVGCPEFAFRVVSFPEQGSTVDEIIESVETALMSDIPN